MTTHSVNTQLLTTSTTIAQSQNSSVVQLDRIQILDLTATIAGANPSNIAFTAAASDLCTTATAHGFTSGVKVQFTTTTTLPAGLSLLTDYYLAVLSSTTFKVCASQADVTAGTYVDITDAGTGTHTVNVTTTLAGSAKLQKTNSTPDEVSAGSAVWIDLDNAEVYNGNNSQTISAAGNLNWLLDNFAARALRAVITITSGTVTCDLRANGKG